MPSRAATPGRYVSSRMSASAASRELVAPRRRGEVEHDPPLAPVPHDVARPCPTVAARRLDPHDVGAVVRQQHRRHRAGHAGGGVEHPHAVEDPAHRRTSRVSDVRIGRSLRSLIAHDHPRRPGRAATRTAASAADAERTRMACGRGAPRAVSAWPVGRPRHPPRRSPPAGRGVSEVSDVARPSTRSASPNPTAVSSDVTVKSIARQRLPGQSTIVSTSAGTTTTAGRSSSRTRRASGRRRRTPPRRRRHHDDRRYAPATTAAAIVTSGSTTTPAFHGSETNSGVAAATVHIARPGAGQRHVGRDDARGCAAR